MSEQRPTAALAREQDASERGARGARGAKGASSAASKLVELVRESGAELFHDSDGTAYARLTIDGHQEVHRLRSKPFRTWLARQYYLNERKGPGAQQVQDARALAQADVGVCGHERRLSNRARGRQHGSTWTQTRPSSSRSSRWAGRC